MVFNLWVMNSLSRNKAIQIMHSPSISEIIVDEWVEQILASGTTYKFMLIIQPFIEWLHASMHMIKGRILQLVTNWTLFVFQYVWHFSSSDWFQYIRSACNFNNSILLLSFICCLFRLNIFFKINYTPLYVLCITMHWTFTWLFSCTFVWIGKEARKFLVSLHMQNHVNIRIS